MATEKLIVVNGITINTILSGEGEQAILFVHGNSCDASFWEDQTTDEQLQKKYKLIAFDLPGHGKSSKSNSYKLQHLASFIPALIDALELKEYLVAGLSFGTSLIAEVAQKLIDCKGFFMASSNITNNSFPPSSYIIPFPEAYAMAVGAVTDDVLTKFAEQFVLNTSSPLVQKYKNSYLQTDPDFRIALGNATQQSEWTDEFLNLSATAKPCFIVFGRQEKILDIHYIDKYPLPWDHSIQTIDNAAHFINNEQVTAFNSMLDSFAQGLFK